MSVYACGCLNVQIHTKEVHPIQSDADDDTLPFLGPEVAEVSLDDHGIVIEQSYLLHRHSEMGWVQYRCVNCSWRTHAVLTTPTSTTVLINTQLENDPATLARHTHSEYFSNAFQIILLDRNLDSVNIQEGPMDIGIGMITDKISSYLEHEEVMMEERIRSFEHEQRLLFEQLKSQSAKDKLLMIRLLLKTGEESQLDNMGDHSLISGRQHTPMAKALKSTPGKKGAMKTRSYSEYDQNPDSEALFYLDELEPELEEPFYESDEDKVPNITHTVKKYNRRCDEHVDLFSTSVPITVPMWAGQRSSSTEDEDEEEVTPSNPDQIAANMQALAESITDTGRYIFGDRPRPRLNTGDSMVRYMERPRERLNTADSIVRRK